MSETEIKEIQEKKRPFLDIYSGFNNYISLSLLQVKERRTKDKTTLIFELGRLQGLLDMIYHIVEMNPKIISFFNRPDILNRIKARELELENDYEKLFFGKIKVKDMIANVRASFDIIEMIVDEMIRDYGSI